MHDILLKISNQIYKGTDHKDLFGTVIEVINLLKEKKQLIGNWHPLGFIHISLGKINNQTIRLHVWSKLERRIQQPFYPIHTHIFELKSHILSGNLRNSTYEINNTNIPYENVIYNVAYNNKESILKRTKNKINFNKVFEENLKKGDYYSVKKGDFHSSEVNEGEFAATIALTYDLDNDVPLVIGDVNGTEEYTYSRNNCTDEELKNIISYLMQYR